MRPFSGDRLVRSLADGRGRRRDDAFRVVHGESDGIPGLLVDRDGDALAMQTLAEATDQRKAELAGMLDELLKPRTIVFRDDGSFRDFEGLPAGPGFIKGTDSRAVFHEGPNAFEMTSSRTGRPARS